MDQEELLARLISGDSSERTALLEHHLDLVNPDLAWALKARYDDARITDPATASSVASALAAIAQASDDQVVSALASWTAGRAALQIDGRPQQALGLLDQAVATFESLSQPQRVATVHVTRLHALALLGQYDEAIDCGLHARDILLAHGDLSTAGTIEQNLGNIYHRRDQYAEAERLLRLAHTRFDAVEDQRQLAQIENCIAIELMFQHRFRDAAELYHQALARAEQAGLEITQAEIEVNLGNLALLQGQYDRSLDYLERSRRHYARLGMLHELATIELELADAYLELNLIPEAAMLYDRIIPRFRTLGMQAELARSLAHSGRSAALRGQPEQAMLLLAEANRLYTAEANPVGAALTTLFEAQVSYVEGDYLGAREAAVRAEAPLSAAKVWLLFARWLRGDCERLLGHTDEAYRLLIQTLAEAEQHIAPQVSYRCQTSLGLIAVAQRDPISAEAAFRQAVVLLEELRAPLPTEEFYTAFVADKLTPYAELVRLCLADGAGRVGEALRYTEQARSRALVEMLGNVLPVHQKPRDAFEAELLARLTELRDELNWLYSQIGRMPERDEQNSPAAMAEIQSSMRERELSMMELTRQMRQRGASIGSAASRAMSAGEMRQLQGQLGADTALIEYFMLDGEFVAFVVTHIGIDVVRDLGHENTIAALVEQLYNQIDTLRYGDQHLAAHMDLLTRRARHYLRALYDALLQPIEHLIKEGQKRLVIVPYRTLHYVPFHALDNGTAYLIEQYEISYAPSASVLRHCLSRPDRPLRSALLIGVADEQLPQVHHEIASLEPLFPQTTVLLDAQATRAALSAYGAQADLLHLACHGQFRPDNPLFSSLRLGDGWLTVYDIYGLQIDFGLVTLSACETGVSAVAPGDELIGIARGFFSTGTPSLLVSLWAADDATTATLMHTFYSHLCAGERPAAALRKAQLVLLTQQQHPFFWAPFVVLGRW